MKTLLFVLFSVVTSVSAQAQLSSRAGDGYREFQAVMTIANGESKTVTIRVNSELAVTAFGDPEIAYHGHHDYRVTGSIQEGDQTCEFSQLLTQASGAKQSTAEVLSLESNEMGSIRLCSGLILEFHSLQHLITKHEIPARLLAAGITLPIGNGKITLLGLKTVEAVLQCSDPWHHQYHSGGCK
jgi:hypothetical protein